MPYELERLLSCVTSLAAVAMLVVLLVWAPTEYVTSPRGNVMFVKHIWSDNPSLRSEVKDADESGWARVEHAIRRLDGMESKELGLMRGDAHGMSIVCSQGNYLCSIVTPGKATKVLVDLNKPKDWRGSEYRAEFQDYPAQYVVSLDAVLAAASTFVISGDADGALDWDEL